MEIDVEVEGNPSIMLSAMKHRKKKVTVYMGILSVPGSEVGSSRYRSSSFDWSRYLARNAVGMPI